MLSTIGWTMANGVAYLNVHQVQMEVNISLLKDLVVFDW